MRRLLALALLLAGSVALAAEEEMSPTTSSGHIAVVRISGSINPASSDYLQTAIAQAEAEGAALLVLELDTPGGLVASTKDIIQAMLGSRVPIAVFVSPQGAWAGSAGTFITLAGHIAAMAPGSSIGAAHPVGIGGGGGGGGSEEEGKAEDPSAEKAENLLAAFIESIAAERDRNVEWAGEAVRNSVAVTADEALELDVIDLVAKDRADLLAQLEGRELEIQGETVVLALAGAEQREIEMGAITRFLNVLVDPNVAVLLLLAGALGLYIEFNQPGTFIPGIVGAICLMLAMIAMQILPFSWLGLLLIAAGLGLFVAEAFVTSYGLLFAAGVACFLAGGSMLFDMPEVSDLNVSFWSVLVPATLGLALFAAIVVVAVGRSLGKPQAAGIGELVGMVGRAETDLDPTGTVFVRGEFWRVRAQEPVAAEASVEVVDVQGMELVVRPARDRS